MLLCVFLLATAVSSALAEDYICYDPRSYTKKLGEHHDKCQKKLASLKHTIKDSCYYTYRKCHVDALNITNSVNGVDQDKYIEMLEIYAIKKDRFKERFSACTRIPQTEEKIEEFFICLSDYCHENIGIRTQFLNYAVGFCM